MIAGQNELRKLDSVQLDELKTRRRGSRADPGSLRVKPAAVGSCGRNLAMVRVTALPQTQASIGQSGLAGSRRGAAKTWRPRPGRGSLKKSTGWALVAMAAPAGRARNDLGRSRQPKPGGCHKQWRRGRRSGGSRCRRGVGPSPAGGAAARGRGVVFSTFSGPVTEHSLASRREAIE